MLVGDDPVLEVDQRRRHDDRISAMLSAIARPSRAQHGAGAQHRRQRLDERVARRDRLTAAAAVSAQQQPGEDRHVVVGLDRRAAAGAVRAGVTQRLVAWQAVDDDVQERAAERAEHACESDPPCVHDRPYAGRA